MLQIITCKIEGISPLIFHNGEGANPVDQRVMPDFLQKKLGFKYFREGKVLSSKKKKSDADHEKLAELGFYSSLYLNKSGKIVYPAKCFQRTILDQARESKLGRQVQRGVLVLQDSLLDFENKNKPLKDLYDLHRYDELVKVSTATTPRTRAIFEKWSAEFTIELATKVIDISTLKEILALGKLYGSCERRPRFGRYKVTKLQNQDGSSPMIIDHAELVKGAGNK